MNVLIVTPAPFHSRQGNRVTARRWAGLLRALGHRVRLEERYDDGRPCDVLVALHANKSAESVARYRRERPDGPLVVALTGTDVYGDIRTVPTARQSLELASRLIVLQPLAVDELAERLRPKARVIFQSAVRPPDALPPARDAYDVCVVGHLRPVKDPFRTALAARRVPAESRLRVLQIGGALSAEMERQASAEQAENPRYQWLGERPRLETLRTLARCRLLVLSSHLEGGANVISEALACGVPVVSSRISGSVGLLGADYPGYFPVGDTDALTALLWRVERDAAFHGELRRRCEQLQPLVDPRRECESWAGLLDELR